MSAETLRKAAALMRGDADPRWHPVADWLDSEAERCDRLTRAMPSVSIHPGNVAEWKLAHAFRVARAHLGESE